MAHNCGREESSRNVDIAIEIEDLDIPLLTSMEYKLQSLHPLSSGRCIYRVPPTLRNINEEAYTPLRVSIGPFHHGKVGLEAMEEHKWRYLQNFLQRSKKGLAEFIQVIKEKEERIRQCYAETIDFGSDQFVEIILVDAAFIIEVLLMCCSRNLRDENDGIFGKPRIILEINRDLRLLENQLPFFILEDLLEKANTSSSEYEGLSIIKLTHKYFKRYLDSEEEEENLETTDPTEVKHLMDFLRICLKPSKLRLQPQRKETVESIHLHCATELDEAGVKFRAGSSKNLFDIEFKSGVLKIPHLKVTDGTESLFRNLLAYEQCHYKARYMSDYVMLIDSLINTRKDVELLVRSKVIENLLGDSEDVSTLFNKLGKEISVNRYKFYFSRLQEQLDDYCNSKWHKWKANLKHDYFKTPWAVISIIGVIVILILTLIQTVCSIISTARNN